MDISGLEDEYRLPAGLPWLIYIKASAPEREPLLKALRDPIRSEDTASYKYFATPDELRELIENDLAVLLTERFELAQAVEQADEALPVQPTTSLPVLRRPLVGREREVAAARSLLLRDDVGC